MKAIVNGASGYIGFHLTETLLKSGHEVYAVCRKNIGLLEKIHPSDDLHIVISEQNETANHFDGIIPDVWYQLAWEGSIGDMRASPEVQIKNELLCVNAMETAKNIGCKKIIFTGTVYENISEPILENPVFDKNSFYIIAKKHAHEMTLQLSKKLDIEYVWCTFCQPVGKYMNEKQLIPYAVKCFANNEPSSFGSCSQYFDIIPVEYLADALVVLGENKCRKNSYYIGSGEPRILKDYLIEAAAVCGYKLDIGFGKRQDDGMVFLKEWFDCSEFKNEFRLKEQHSFESLLKPIFKTDRSNQ
ncbi:MAG: NAD-dependent epimerase/dehydratase family protein [Oscillospiraceae bacterium]